MNNKDHQFEAEKCACYGKAFSQAADSDRALEQHYAVKDPVASKHHADRAEAGEAAAAFCAKAGQRHLDAMDTNEGPQSGGVDRASSELKVSIDRLNEKLSKMAVPSGVSVVPRHDHPRGTLVPRPGQPDHDAQKALKYSVQPELKDIIFDPK